MNELFSKLAKSPNAGHLVILLVIAGGGGANYSRVDTVALDVAAIREAQTIEKDQRRDLEIRVAVLESQNERDTP